MLFEFDCHMPCRRRRLTPPPRHYFIFFHYAYAAAITLTLSPDAISFSIFCLLMPLRYVIFAATRRHFSPPRFDFASHADADADAAAAAAIADAYSIRLRFQP